MSVTSTAAIVAIVLAITFSTFQSLGTDPSGPTGSRLPANNESTPVATPASGASDEVLAGCTVPVGDTLLPRIVDMSVWPSSVQTVIGSPVPGGSEPVSIVRVDTSVWPSPVQTVIGSPVPGGSEPVSFVPFDRSAPASLVIEQAQVNAGVETLTIVDGIMKPPSGQMDVAWYVQTALPGEVGNVVMVGYVDYWDVGPAVFFHIQDLDEGDEIVVTGTDGIRHVYTVEWVELYEVADLTDETAAEIVGPTQEASITLITCGGEFDYDRGVYLSRTVVRGTLTSINEGTPVPVR